jgi:hypothetical protein
MYVLTLYHRPQAEVFENFLHGETLEECYQAVADIGNRWLDMLEVIKSSPSMVKFEIFDHCISKEEMGNDTSRYGRIFCFGSANFLLHISPWSS